jgi:hypothetical protein
VGLVVAVGDIVGATVAVGVVVAVVVAVGVVVEVVVPAWSAPWNDSVVPLKPNHNPTTLPAGSVGTAGVTAGWVP